MSTDQTWTVGELLQWTAEYFRKHAFHSPRLDAEILLAESRGCQRIDLYTAYDEPASPEVRAKFRELVRRRATGEPVAYLVGHREFFSISLEVNPHVLIPRPETEQLVTEVLEELRDRQLTEPRVADVGTGSGAIAIAVALHAPQAVLTAMDISPEALDVAQRNAERTEVAERIDFLLGDLLSPTADRQQPCFDFIVSNLPYLGEPEMAELPREVRDFEPRLALVGGSQGTELIERLIKQAETQLADGGCLILEVSPIIQARVVECLQVNAHFQRVELKSDLAGLSRVVVTSK